MIVRDALTSTTLEEGEDWRRIKNLLDMSRDTTSNDNFGVKRTDPVSTIKSDSVRRKPSVELKKKQEMLKGSITAKVMQFLEEKQLASNVKASFLKAATKNHVSVVSSEIDCARIS